MPGHLQLVSVGCHAMATRFEIAAWGEAETHLRAAGEAALAEVQRLDAELSRFRSDSEIYEVNARAAYEPVRVTPSVFSLLSRAAALSAETQGAFDITLAPLMAAWGFWADAGRVPDDAEIEAARSATGMQFVRLTPETCEVRFEREGITLDLGALGKGYAVERAAAILREARVAGALIHGGTSSILAVGDGPDTGPWRVAVRDPSAPEHPVATVALVDATLSVSAVHGRAFTFEGTRYGHVIDPRSGRPTRAALLAAVVGPSATEGDALSTALLVSGETLLERMAATRPEWSALIVRDAEPRASGYGVFGSHLQDGEGSATPES